MIEEIQITRCPMCGCARLQAVYDKSSDKRITKGYLFFGWIGLLVSLFRNRNAQSKFWKCEQCGHEFPMV